MTDILPLKSIMPAIIMISRWSLLPQSRPNSLVKNTLFYVHFDTLADVLHRFKYALFDYKYYQLIE